MAILRLPSSSIVLPGLPMMAAFGIFYYGVALILPAPLIAPIVPAWW